MGSSVSVVKFTFLLHKVANFNVHLIEMAGGNSDQLSSNNLTNENDDKNTESNFVDARVDPNSTNPNLNSRFPKPIKFESIVNKDMIY